MMEQSKSAIKSLGLAVGMIALTTACGNSFNQNQSEFDGERIITPELLKQHMAADKANAKTSLNSDALADFRIVVGDELADAGNAESNTAPAELNWHSVIMTGDNSIRVFDNARKKIAELYEGYGVDASRITQLSRTNSEQVNGVLATSKTNFKQAMLDQNIGENDACSVYLTSHGTSWGFYIRGESYLTPTQMDEILDEACGDRPQVILISACFSGVFAEPVMQAPNRIIMTAARKDRSSFGCSSEHTYTFWDGCVIDNIEASQTWAKLAENVRVCIEAKESRLPVKPSFPQTRLGEQLQGLRIFSK